MADLTVLYQNCERIDQVESNDSVVLGSESLITSLHKGKHRSVCKKCCCNRQPSFVTIFAGIVILLMGLIIGLLIGRASVSCHGNSSIMTDDNDYKGDKNCNCTSNNSNDSFTTQDIHPRTETTVTTRKHQSMIPTSPPCTCAPCKITTESPPPTSTSASDVTTSDNTGCKFCEKRNPDVSKGNETQYSLFAPLTIDEMQSVRIAARVKLNMTVLESLSDDRISHIYLYPTPKDVVLHYLDNNGTFPGRYAKVHVNRGSRTPPDVMEYKVGPLNVSFNDMSVTKLRQDGEIAYNRRPYETFESNILYNFMLPFLKNVSTLIEDSLDEGYSEHNVFPSFAFQPCWTISDRISNVVVVLNLEDARTLGLLPVSCVVHHPGTDTSLWYTSDWYYNSHGPYSDVKDMLSDYQSGSFSAIKLGTNYIHDKTREFELVRNESLPPRFQSDIPPPKTYEPRGPRYSITGHRVKWMGWDMEITSDPIRGPAIFDIHFLRERIAYEISLQDITLLYSAQSNGHGPIVLSDTFYHVGTYNNPIRNVDCPARSYVMNTTLFLVGTVMSEEALCIFEADGQTPLWRHGDKGLTDHYLVIRAALNLGNYDYIVEWNFHLDGSIRTLLTASGYLYGAFWKNKDTMTSGEDSFSPFGYRLGKYLQGPIHDHTYTFKVDLDVLGSKNSLETMTWKAGSSNEVFQNYLNISRPLYFLFNDTRYVTSEILDTETSFITDPKNPKFWTVVNEEKRNKWGSKRGYRIIPQTMFAEILHDHVMLKPWDQLKFHVAICQRKDSEPYATNSIYDVTHPDAQPISGFIKLDNENIRKEDLVILISNKFYHLPTTEDVPITIAAKTSFTLKPFNYFDRTPTFDLNARYSATDPYSSVPCYENL